MTISIIQLIIVILAVVGIVWAYPKLPSPGNWILAVVVAVVCVVILLNIAGVTVVR